MVCSTFNKLVQIAYKLFVLVLFIFTQSKVQGQSSDSTNFNNQIIGIGGSSFRLPYGQDSQGNYIPAFSHKIKADYTFMINSFLMIKSGITYQYSDTIFSNKQNTYLIDIIGTVYRKKLHFDVGLHFGNYSTRLPPVNTNGPLAQYISIGGGVSLPISKKWAFDLTMRNSINITFKDNSYLNIFEGFIGIQYFIIGNNNYLNNGYS